MHILNNSIWCFSLVLECMLLAMLFIRRRSGEFPLFTALIGLYTTRSIVLFTVFGHLEISAYALIYSALSVFDLVLQTLVAWELFSSAPLRPRYRPVAQRAAVFSALVVAAGGGSWLLSLFIPATTRNPVDRGILFTSLLMLAVFGVVSERFSVAAGRRVLQGFAALGVVGILTQVGRSAAALHRDARAYTRWSYVEPAAYLAVLLFWLAAFARRVPEQDLHPRLVSRDSGPARSGPTEEITMSPPNQPGVLL